MADRFRERRPKASSPAACMRPSFFSALTRRMLIELQMLPGRRGVKRMV